MKRYSLYHGKLCKVAAGDWVVFREVEIELAAKDAANAAELATLRAQLAEVEAERDAAIAEIAELKRDYCGDVKCDACGEWVNAADAVGFDCDLCPKCLTEQQAQAGEVGG